MLLAARDDEDDDCASTPTVELPTPVAMPSAMSTTTAEQRCFMAAFFGQASGP
jgi:hypothetical protein